MKTEITINEFYSATINENGDKIDNDIDLLRQYVDDSKYKELSKLAVCTDNICLTTYESHNGISICGNEGAFDKEFADDTLLDEVIDYIIAEMKKMMEEKLYYVILDCADGYTKVTKNDGSGRDSYPKEEALKIASDMLEVGGVPIIIMETELAECPECGTKLI